MKKLVLFTESLVGTKDATAYLVPLDMSEKELEDFAWGRAVEAAEMYGIYPTCDAPEGEEDSDEYSDDISGWWEEYDADKHDGQLIYGNNSTFEWNEI